MSATAAADPIRAQVEETLHELLDAVIAVPCSITRRVRDTAGRSVDRVSTVVTTSVGLARSVGELVLGGLLGRDLLRPAANDGSRAPSTLPEHHAADGPSVVDGAGEPESDAETLPLEGYESLAASQVVARLDRLSQADLAQIKEFELANRGRRTILGKIDQLLNA